MSSSGTARCCFRRALAVCAVTALISQPAISAPAAIGQITPTGATEVNGVAVARGSAVFSGDQIKTGEHATALLALAAGRQAILEQQSSLQLAAGSKGISGTLGQGYVAVLSPANDPVVIEAGGTRIVPGKDGSVYGVRLAGNRLSVSNKRGSVSVETADRSVAVPEGRTLEASLEAAENPSGAGVKSAIASSRLATLAIVVGAGLAATTLTLLVRDLNTNCRVVSPSALGQCEVTH